MLWKIFIPLAYVCVMGVDSNRRNFNQRLEQSQLSTLRYPDYLHIDSYSYYAQYPYNLRAHRRDQKSFDQSFTTAPNSESRTQPSAQVANAAPSPAMPIANPIPREKSSMATSTVNPSEMFSTSLLPVVAYPHSTQNVVYSPISLQMLLAYVYIGARDATAQELERGLKVSANKQEVAQQFRKIMQSQSTSGDAQLIMANKLYHSPSLVPNDGLNDYARNYFQSEIEAINFGSSTAAAQKINDWVAEKTQNHIRDLVEPNSLDARTQAILVNAIYFKAKWENEFSAHETSKENFRINSKRNKSVNMMFNSDSFNYGDFPSLGVQVLEMPYRNSNLSMMVILPYDFEGLTAAEGRMSNTLLNDLSASLTMTQVTVRIPKFKIEFDLDMVQPLKMLGIRKIFTPEANLGEFFSTGTPPQIAKVQHKAYIEVNEAGSEAAAASFAKIVPLSLPPRSIYFTADHPFLFAIRGPQAVYFVGHVVNP